MSQRIVWILIALGVLVVLGVFYNSLRLGSVQPSVQPVATTSPTPTPGLQGFTMDLASLTEASQSGMVVITETDGKLKIAIDMVSGPKDVPQPAHIHIGKCPGIGEIKYPLENVVNGKSETMLEATLDQLFSELPLAINVHKSEKDLKTYVSCGDIPEKSQVSQ